MNSRVEVLTQGFFEILKFGLQNFNFLHVKKKIGGSYFSKTILVRDACHDVDIEPHIHPLQRETFAFKSPTTDYNA